MKIDIGQAFNLAKNKQIYQALELLSSIDLRPDTEQEALCLRAYCLAKISNFSDLNQCLEDIDLNKTDHTALSLEILGDMYRDNADHKSAVTCYAHSLVIETYNWEIMEKLRESSNRYVTESIIDYFPVKSIEEYAGLDSFYLNDSENSSSQFIELHDAHVIGQNCFLFTKDWEYLVPKQDVQQANRIDIVASTRVRNILGYVQSTALGARNRVLASIPKDANTFEKGIVLGHRAPDNFYHWLIEVIPKWMLIEDDKQYSQYPIITSAHMPAQHFEILKKLVGEDRKIVALDYHQRLDIEKAIVPAIPSYVGFEPRPGVKLQDVDVVYSRKAINYLREKFKPDEGTSGSLKIFLSRKSSSLSKRKIINQEEIETLFKKMGFEIIDTAKLSFQQQVNLFSSAKIIAGASGASFSNLIFCPPETKLLIILSDQFNLGIYFRKLAEQCELTDWRELLVGGLDGQVRFDSDYEVQIDQLERMLLELEV